MIQNQLNKMYKIKLLANLHNLNKYPHNLKIKVLQNLKINNLKFKKLSFLRLQLFFWMIKISLQRKLLKKMPRNQLQTQNLKQISHNNLKLLNNNL
jgi:hypothetical protein